MKKLSAEIKVMLTVGAMLAGVVVTMWIHFDNKLNSGFNNLNDKYDGLVTQFTGLSGDVRELKVIVSRVEKSIDRMDERSISFQNKLFDLLKDMVRRLGPSQVEPSPIVDTIPPRTGNSSAIQFRGPPQSQ